MLLDKLRKISIKSNCCNKKITVSVNINHIDECETEDEVKDILFKKLRLKPEIKKRLSESKINKIV